MMAAAASPDPRRKLRRSTRCSSLFRMSSCMEWSLELATSYSTIICLVTLQFGCNPVQEGSVRREIGPVASEGLEQSRRLRATGPRVRPAAPDLRTARGPAQPRRHRHWRTGPRRAGSPAADSSAGRVVGPLRRPRRLPRPDLQREAYGRDCSGRRQNRARARRRAEGPTRTPPDARAPA